MAAQTSINPDHTGTRHRRIRVGMAALVGGFVLFGAGEVLHGPETLPSESLREFAAQVTATRSIVAHTLFVPASILLLFGAFALYAYLATTRAERGAFAGLVLSVTGYSLILTVFGVAVFVFPTASGLFLENRAGAGDLILGLEYLVPLLYASVGLVIIGSILFAVAVWRSGTLAKRSGVPYALAFPTILATENAPDAVKALVALLVIAGSVWLVSEVWRRTEGGTPVPHASDQAVEPAA